MAKYRRIQALEGGLVKVEREDGVVGTYDPVLREFKPEMSAEQEAADILDLPGPEDEEQSQNWQAQAKKQMLNPGFGGMMPLGPGLGQPSQSQEVPPETAARMGRGATSASLGAFGGAITPAATGASAFGIGAGAAGGAFAGPESEGVGTEAGGTVAALIANKAQEALESRIPGGRMLGAGLRALGVQGLAAFAGTAAGTAAERKLLGQEQKTAAGGSFFVLPTAAGIMAGGVGGTFAAANKYFNNLKMNPTRAIAALNDLRETSSLKDIPQGLPEAVGSPWLRKVAMTKDWSEKISAGVDKFAEEAFPSQLSNSGIQRTHELLGRIFKFPAEGRAPRPGSFVEELTAAMGKEELALLKAFVNAKPKNAEALMRQLFKSDDTLTMLGVLKKATKVTGDLEIIDELANEWVVRDLLLTSSKVNTSARAGFREAGAGGTEHLLTLNGEAIQQRIRPMKEKIDAVFGPKRAKALADLASAMDFLKPEAAFGQGGMLERGIRYNASRSMFIIANASAGGAAGAMLANVASLPLVAGGAIGMIGLATMARAIVNNPGTATLLLEAVKDPTGAAIQPLMRALIAGQTDPGLPSGQAPPALRSNR